MYHSAIMEISQHSETSSPQQLSTTPILSFFPTLPLEHQRRIYHTTFSPPERDYQSDPEYQTYQGQEQESPHHDHVEPTISTFHLFPTLPPELRAQIWTATLPTARHIS